jgi:hypothetical protein
MTDLYELDAVEAKRLYDAEREGDIEAKEFWANLFRPGVECFLCGLPTEPQSENETIRRVSLVSDPNGDSSKLLAVPYCLSCASLPPMYRAARELKLLKATWPATGWGLFRAPMRRPLVLQRRQGTRTPNKGDKGRRAQRRR